MSRGIHQQRSEPERVSTRRDNEDEGSNIRLPPVKIPEFTGNYEEWLNFKDLFKSIVQDNPKLSDIQKFQYLKSSLQGEAALIISGFEISAENYAEAWDLLTSTYQNNKLLINIHMNKLLKLALVEKGKYSTIKQLVVHVRTHLKALKTLKLPVDNWDELLIHLIEEKLEYNIQKSWEEEINRKEEEDRPKLEDFLVFLSDHCRTMELINNSKPTQEVNRQGMANKRFEKKVYAATSGQESCSICEGDHRVYKCDELLKMGVSERVEKIKSARLCLNCLGPRHLAKDCRSSSCRKCDRKHNTLLHYEDRDTKTEAKESSAREPSAAAVASACTTEDTTQEVEDVIAVNVAKKGESHVILSTAQISIEDSNGYQQNCRALLDPGSQANLITEELARKLNIKPIKTSQIVSGINNDGTSCTEIVRVKVRSTNTNFVASMECVIMPTIIERLPQTKIDGGVLYVLKEIGLADPKFDVPGNIDLLIGAGMFWRVLCKESIPQKTGAPQLQKTLLGWIIGGELKINKTKGQANICGLVTNSMLKDQLQRFWKQEEIPEARQLTQEEIECEQQFSERTSRDTTGRFVVSLPQKPGVILGESEYHAISRLYALERRFKANPELKQEYVRFMADYEDREHMSLVSADTTENAQEICILPHQPVVRLDSLTTKLRVVFDASAKTSSGTTLHDKLMMGPNFQNELFHVILRFRAHQIAITADIEAMYRQILVAQEDRNLQRVLWRSESTQPIKTYCFNTLTYGTAPAPYLAIRCLRELAEQETEYQEAAEVLKRDFYMDDLSSGASTVEKAIALQKQLFNLLQKGQFNLRKWRCNKEEVLEHLKEEQEEKGLLQLNKEGALKTLGLLWNAKADTVKYTVDIGEETEVTRRIIVSRVAQIFDPLGLLGPVLINGKCIMQQTWLAPVGWDDELPEELQKSWNRYYSSLQSINEFEIPRNVNPGNATEKFDIFGFGDASEKACGACLYAVSQDNDGNKKSSLICAKNKVAPVKTVSLPRLELDVALMLLKLCSTAQQAYGNKVQKIYLWSDSTIVLHQIATSPNLLKTYVANRVTRIQNLTQNAAWLHVPSSDNPADVLSRGLAVDEWKKNTLWWHGPDWIHTEEGWPAQPSLQKSIPDQLELKTIVAVAAVKFDDSILRKYSSYDKLVRVIAYCLRFKFKTLETNKIEAQEEADVQLSIHELRQAEIVIVRLTQTEVFSTEQHMIRDGKPIPRDSRLAALNPSLDQDGLFIVGGRLRHAQIPEAQKHQIILPSKHPVTTLIMRKEHERLLHCGSEQLLYSVRQQF